MSDPTNADILDAINEKYRKLNERMDDIKGSETEIKKYLLYISIGGLCVAMFLFFVLFYPHKLN